MIDQKIILTIITSKNGNIFNNFKIDGGGNFDIKINNNVVNNLISLVVG